MNRASSFALVLGATSLFVGCSSVPDVTFVDDLDGGTVTEDATTRSDASARDASSNASTRGCPTNVPPFADRCCGSVPCSGSECSVCDACMRKGCDRDEGCCTQGRSIVCRSLASFSCK